VGEVLNSTIKTMQAVYAYLKGLRQLLQPKRLAILEACLIGLVSAITASLLRQGVHWLGNWRVSLAQSYPAWIVLPIFGLLGGLLAGWLIERVAPETAGSGMSQVKAFLAKVPVALDLRVALVKFLSSILVLGSGLALGREGPTVQVGAALSAQLSRWMPTSPDYRRQLIAAGVGAGLAAAFNAPIAGVLFVVEELLKDVSGFTLGTAILASFIASVVSRQLGGAIDLTVSLDGINSTFKAIEIPFYLLLGLLGGCLGALFNYGVLASVNLNRRIPLGIPWRIGLAGAVSGLIVALLPSVLRDQVDLQTLLLTGHDHWKNAAIAFVVQFALVLLAAGSGAPGGLLVPTLLLGSALGYCIGTIEYVVLQASLPEIYAKVGMGVFMSATAGVPVTATVLIFEFTTDFTLVLPLMIASITAYLVSKQLFPDSLYEKLLELGGIILPKDTAIQESWVGLLAEQVMQGQVETLNSEMTLEETIQAFARSHHRGFPVLTAGRLTGIITQTDLATAAQRQLPSHTPIADLMTPQPVTVSPNDTLTDVLYLLNRYGLSRLPVIEGRKLVGIITRSDIIRAESAHLSGDARQSGPKTAPSYQVYRTRDPAIGQGRLLVLLSNPQTAPILVRLAATIANDRQYELDCLHILEVARDRTPAETSVETVQGRRLLQQAVRLARQWQIPTHSQIRVSHDLAQTILETIQSERIDLVLMGWKGTTSTPGRIFGSAVDTIIRQAPCSVLLAKLAPTPPEQLPPFDRWLVPLAGGPNALHALHWLPAMTVLSQAPEIQLCQVFQPNMPPPPMKMLEGAVRILKRRYNCAASACQLCSPSIVEGILDLAEAGECDVIVLGASREGLLQQTLKGNIPAMITRTSTCTVILVRGAITDNERKLY
jgi:chloride channel protein, CIC family